MTESIRVVVVDDHPVILDALRPYFEKAEGMELCGEARSAAEAFRVVESLRPDVAVIDYSLHDGNAIDVMEKIRSRGLKTPVIVYTGFYGYRIRLRSIKAGAAGYVPKDQPTEKLIRAVREVAEGRKYFGPPATAPTWLDARKNPNPNGTHPTELLMQLTEREMSILELLEGLKNEEIADALSLAPTTVRNRASDVYRKLGVANRTEAAAFLARWG